MRPRFAPVGKIKKLRNKETASSGIAWAIVIGTLTSLGIILLSPNPPYGILEGAMETSASCEALFAPLLYSTATAACPIPLAVERFPKMPELLL
jgi:hypothetical protein